MFLHFRKARTRSETLAVGGAGFFFVEIQQLEDTNFVDVREKMARAWKLIDKRRMFVYNEGKKRKGGVSNGRNNCGRIKNKLTGKGYFIL